MTSISIHSGTLATIHSLPSFLGRLLGRKEYEALVVRTDKWRWEMNGKPVPRRLQRALNDKLWRTTLAFNPLEVDICWKKYPG